MNKELILKLKTILVWIMIKTIYQNENNRQAIINSAKDILNNISSKDYNSYIGVKIITLTNRQIIVTRYEKDKYSVLIRNAIGNKIDEFIINNINNEKFDFI